MNLYLKRSQLKDELPALDCRANPMVWHAWKIVQGRAMEYVGHFNTKREAEAYQRQRKGERR